MRISGPTEDGEPVARSLQWVVANSGTTVWQEGTILRQVAGPALGNHTIGVPPAQPGQTVIIDLELMPNEEPATISYALFAPSGERFGPPLVARVAGTKKAARPAPGELEALQKLLAATRPDEGSWPGDVQLELQSGQGNLRRYRATSAASPGFSRAVTISIGDPGDTAGDPAQGGPDAIGNGLSTAGGAVHQETAAPDDDAPAAACDKELLAASLARLSQCDWDAQEACLRTLLKIVGNISLDPRSAKFRQVPKSSKRFAADVLSVPGGTGVLQAAGFIEDGDAWCLPEDAGSLRRLLAELQGFAQDATMRQRRRERDAKIQVERARKKNYLVNAPRLDEDMQATMARIKNDQEEIAAQRSGCPSKDSKAKSLSWGAKVNDSAGSVQLGAKAGGALGGGQTGT